jgi:hypothetical protein
MAHKLEHLERLYDALRTPLGVVVETEDREALRQKFYMIRRDNMEEFGCLSFILSPTNPAHLWILKRPTNEKP